MCTNVKPGGQRRPKIMPQTCDESSYFAHLKFSRIWYVCYKQFVYWIQQKVFIIHILCSFRGWGLRRMPSRVILVGGNLVSDSDFRFPPHHNHLRYVGAKHNHIFGAPGLKLQSRQYIISAGCQFRIGNSSKKMRINSGWKLKMQTRKQKFNSGRGWPAGMLQWRRRWCWRTSCPSQIWSSWLWSWWWQWLKSWWSWWRQRSK